MISVNQLSVSFGGTSLFDDVSFVVSEHDKIALVGKNGAGKSTMLKIFAGLQQPTTGNVSIPKDTKVGYLPQTMLHIDGKTVVEEAREAFDFLFELQKKIEKMGEDLAARTDYESDSYKKLIDDLTHANEQLVILGINSYQADIEKTLLGLGFERKDFNRQSSEFSGGWRMRIELAKILLRKPDVLLLDEPTNHLDIESIQWLENFLKMNGCAVLLVSHDRAFLDSVTNRTIEISCGHIYDYKVPYTKFMELRKERREQQQRAFDNQQKEIQDTEAFIERFRYKATKAVQVQSRIKALNKIERIEIDDEDTSTINLKFPPAPHSGEVSLLCKDLTKAYGDHVVLDSINVTIKRGEKVAFVGKNGEGKSTLVKCIINELNDYTGTLKLGHLVKIGYFAQNQASLLDENLTVFDTIDKVAVGEIRTKIRDILGAFRFGGEASDKKVKVLSGGERTRLAMIRLLLEPVNVLVLDEPTNHLDIPTKEVLKKAINAFDGTAIIVSHDRDFLNGLVEKTYEFTHHKVVEHLGGIYQFLEDKKMESLRELDTHAYKKTENAPTAQPEEKSAGKLSYEEQKEQMKKVRKAEKDVQNAEADIARLEKEIAEMEEKLSNPDVPDYDKLLQEYPKLQHALEQRMYEWELLSEELENCKKGL